MQNSRDSIVNIIGQSPDKTKEGRVRITGPAYTYIRGSAQVAHLHMFTGFVHQNPALL
jgi:hypothetical protein